MRALIVVVAVVGCSEHRREPSRGSAAPPASPAPVKPVATHAADRLVAPGACVAPPADGWTGKWDGGRPFDNANPLAHRGPTRITITGTGDRLHVSEGVGAAGYELDVTVDGNLAHGEKTSTKTHGAVSLETGARSEITVTDEVAIAACFDARGALHLWRILGASGQGIQATHEEDEVVLARVPVRPVPPPPKGFTVLAEDEHPFGLALSHDDVIWSTADGGMPTMSAIRAVPRKGGAVRELATGIPFIHRLIVRGDYVYFGGHESIGRVPLAGGKVETLVDGVRAMDLAVDDRTLAFDDLDTVQVTPIAGGTPRSIYAAKDADIGGIVLDGGALYVAVRPISLDKPGTIVRVPTTGGHAMLVARQTTCGDSMVGAGGALLVASCDGPILRIDTRGGAATKLTKDTSDVNGIAVAGATIVYALGAGRGILGAVTGGAQRTVLEGDFDPEAIAVDPADPKTVYVLDKGIDLDNPHGRIGSVAL